jgi:hypothetical protein
MATISTILKTKRDGTLTISDGSGKSLVVKYENGSFALNVPKAALISTLDRGELGDPPSLRKGDDQPMSGTFTAYLRDVSDDTYITLEEICLDTGYYDTTWVSTLGVGAEVKTLTLQWDIAGIIHGDPTDHRVILPFLHLTGSLTEGDPSTLAMAYTSYAVKPSSVV